MNRVEYGPTRGGCLLLIAAAFLRMPFDDAAGNRLKLSFWVQSDQRSRCAVWARIGRSGRALFKAFHARHTFGTTGSKIALLVTSGDHLMGDKVKRVGETPIPLRIRVVTDRPVRRVVIFRNNEIVYSKEPVEDEKELTVEWTDKDVPTADRLWYYVRIHRDDDELAWSSPGLPKMWR